MPPKKQAAAASNGTSASTTKKRAIDVKAWASPEPVKVEKGSKSMIEDAKTGKANGKSPPSKKAKKEVEVKKGAKKAKIEKPKIKNINYSTMPSLLPDNWYENSKSKIFVGAHVSIGGGIENAVFEAAAIGAQSFALFLCSQRTWNVKPLDDASIAAFKKACKEHGFPSHLILPHASYLVNIGSGDEEIRNKSLTNFVDGLTRCDKLDIAVYNFHPGSTANKISREECIQNIADGINHGLSKTKKVIAVIENMCKQGNTIGGDFKEIKAIIDLVEDKSRVGVCLDTCHAFAAGYDLSTEKGYEKMLKEFDDTIGLGYLKALHLNDSKGPADSHLDRHENIGKGKIGIEAFKRIVNDKRLKDIPMILETPVVSEDTYKKEIAQLYSLI